MNVRSLAVVLSCLATIFVGAPALAADPVYPQGGRIGIEAPAGMTPASGFAGFEDARSGASVLITEMPDEAFAQIETTFDKTAPSGVVFEGVQERMTLGDGSPAILWRGRQTAHGQQFRKWLLLVDGSDVTALVTVQAPEQAAQYSDEVVVRALRTVSIRPGGTIEQAIGELPFRIGDLAGFRPVRTISGSSLLLTEGPRDVDPNHDQPLVIVAASLGEARVADRVAFARRAFEGLGGFDDKVIDLDRDDGASVLVAGRANGPGGKTLRLRQIILFSPTGYVRTVCVAQAGIDIADRCDRLTQSISVSR